MELYKPATEVARWALDRAFNVGSFVLWSTGQEHIADRLYASEPVSRARTALQEAQHALSKQRPDQELAWFALRRAAVATATAHRRGLNVPDQLGQQIVQVAIEDLPDNEIGSRVAEYVTSEALEALAPPHILPPHEGDLISGVPSSTMQRFESDNGRP